MLYAIVYFSLSASIKSVLVLLTHGMTKWPLTSWRFSPANISVTGIGLYSVDSTSTTQGCSESATRHLDPRTKPLALPTLPLNREPLWREPVNGVNCAVVADTEAAPGSLAGRIFTISATFTKKNNLFSIMKNNLKIVPHSTRTKPSAGSLRRAHISIDFSRFPTVPTSSEILGSQVDVAGKTHRTI